MTFDMRLTHAAHVAALDLTLDRNWTFWMRRTMRQRGCR